MLEQVSIRGFKSIEDLTLDLGLINVFIGANGSGKSNVLEAIGILGAAAAARRPTRRPGPLQDLLPRPTPQDHRPDRARRSSAYRIELQDPLEGLAAWRFKAEQLTQPDEPKRVVWRTSRAAQPAGLDPESGLAALKLIEFAAEAPVQQLMGTLRDFAIYAPNTATATLNPRLARGLIQHLCRWTFARPEPRQLLLTCHNPLALDGLPLQDDRVRLFAVDRSSRGRTVVQRVVYTDKLRALAEEKGWPLSRLWVMGDLGGVPNL